MINLLPPQHKKEILKEEKLKLIFILGVLAWLFLVVFVLFLSFIKIYSAGKTENQKILAERAKISLEASGAQNLEEEIKLINQKLVKLNNFYQEQADLTKFISNVSDILPKGLYLTSLSSNALSQEDNKFLIYLAGLAPTRQLLLEFKKNLDAHSEFSEVDFPPLNWLKAENINFTVTFKAEL